jgi:hypothetical protein
MKECKKALPLPAEFLAKISDVGISVGEVATSAPGDQELFAQGGILFQEKSFISQGGAAVSGEHTARTATHDDCVPNSPFMCHTPLYPI